MDECRGFYEHTRVMIDAFKARSKLAAWIDPSQLGACIDQSLPNRNVR